MSTPTTLTSTENGVRSTSSSSGVDNITIPSSPSKDSLASNMSAKLERIFSESKSISNNIANKQQSFDDVDYKQVLTEFHKMISQLSDTKLPSNNNNNNTTTTTPATTNRSSPRAKRVTFSDHIVDLDTQDSSCSDGEDGDNETATASWSPSNKATNDNSTKSVDNAHFYAGLFQDALRTSKILPPALASLAKDNQSILVGASGPAMTNDGGDSSTPAPKISAPSKGLGRLTDMALDLVKTEKR